MPIKLFYCYAHEDKELREEMDRHLSTLKHLGVIRSWYDGEILPGAAWEKGITDQLNTADLILLLITSYFLSSDYCYSTEMVRALERHKAGEATVIPILLRPVDWEGSPFSILQILPSNAQPVTRWTNRDDAFEDIARGIRRTISKVAEHPTARQLNLEQGPLPLPSKITSSEELILKDLEVNKEYERFSVSFTLLSRHKIVFQNETDNSSTVYLYLDGKEIYTNKLGIIALKTYQHEFNVDGINCRLIYTRRAWDRARLYIDSKRII